MKKGDNSYRSILRGTSIFGGVQMFQILISLVRGKFVALFLGPAGMGISSLFTSTADTLQRVSSLGLNLAIVKEVAAAGDDPRKVREVFEVSRRMIYLSALAGALVCLLGASLLSDFAFGNTDHTPGMMLLGAVVFLTVAWQGEMSVLQGMHKVRVLSRASIVGSLTGLCVGVPLYWLLGTQGIVPAMLVYALVMLVFYSLAVRRLLGRERMKFLWNEHKGLVKSLITMGLILMSSDLIGSLCTYLLNLYIRIAGTVESVGFWQAANSMTNQYAAVVFAAMALDFLPRLSAAVSRNDAFDDIVNRQTEIVALMVTPLAALLILFAPLVVKILLVDSFRPVIPLLRLMALALVFRGIMYPLGYVTFAKDNKKVFFWLEGVGCNILMLVLNALGFSLFGLEGIGYAMIADSIITLFIYMAVNGRLYSFRFSGAAVRCIISAVLLGTATLAASYIASAAWSYALMGTSTAAAILIGAKGLLRRLRLRHSDE